MNSTSKTQRATEAKRRRIQELLVKNIIKTYRECEAEILSFSDVVEDEMISFRVEKSKKQKSTGNRNSLPPKIK